MLGLYLRDVIPFRHMVNPETPRHGFLFADKDKPWGTDVITKVLTTETEARIAFRLTWSEYRHIAKAIDRKFIRGEDADLDDNDDLDDDSEDDLSAVHDLMQAHSRRTGDQKYAQMSGITRQLSSESIDLFRNVSDRWQRWFKLVSRQPRDDIYEPEKKTQAPEEPIETQLVKAMHDRFGRSNNWRSAEQKEATIAVATGVSPLFITFPTGFGKSFCFLLPAMLKRAGSTILIVPLVALAEDMLKRCQDARIDCIIYGRTPARMAKVIIVIPETAIGKQFTHFANEIKLLGKLDRIVWDEVHKMGTDTYRPKIMESCNWTLGTQEVFITATSPPYLHTQFKRRWKIQDERMIRIPNQKPRVCYNVHVFEDDDFE